MSKHAIYVRRGRGAVPAAPVGGSLIASNSATQSTQSEVGLTRYGLAVSFEVASPADLGWVEVTMQRQGSGPTTIKAEVRNDSAGSPGTVLAVSDIRAGGALPASYARIRFQFPRARVTDGVTYWLNLWSSSLSGANYGFWARGDGASELWHSVDGVNWISLGSTTKPLFLLYGFPE